MRKPSKISAFLLACASAFLLSACADPYQDYASSGLRAIEFSLNGEEACVSSFLSASPTENAELFTDFESYAAYDFPLDYTEEFFEENDLLVFIAVAGSSDEMRFFDILTHDGKLYPCYSRVKIRPGSGTAEDIIYLSYCAESEKSEGRTLGEVIYRYR